MLVYVVEANFYDGENSHSQVISIRTDKIIAERDASEYQSIQEENKKLAQQDYDYLFNEWDKLEDQDIYDEQLSKKISDCEYVMYSDFINVTISEYEFDKLLINKEDIKYVPSLQVFR